MQKQNLYCTETRDIRDFFCQFNGHTPPQKKVVMSKIELALILVIMSVLTFKTAVILHIFWWPPILVEKTNDLQQKS